LTNVKGLLVAVLLGMTDLGNANLSFRGVRCTAAPTEESLW